MSKKGIYWAFCAVVLPIIFLHNGAYIVAKLTLGENYKSIVPEYTRDERHYLRQLQTALEGNFNPNNRYIYEHYIERQVGTQYSQILQPFNLCGYLGKLMGFKDIFQWAIFTRSVFPLVAFALIYRIFRSLSFTRAISFIIALLILLKPFAIFGRIEFLSRPLYEVLASHKMVGNWYEQIFASYLPFARLVNPNFSGIFFLSALLFFIKWILKPRRYEYLGVFIIFLFFCFKMYFYFWSTLGALLFTAFLTALIRKEKQIFLPLLLLLILSVPYFLTEMMPYLSEGIEELRSYRGYVPGRRIIISPGVVESIILIIGAILIFLKGHKDKNFLPYLIFLLPGTVILVKNQQIVTGRIVQPWHYTIYVTPLLLPIALFLILKQIKGLRNFFTQKLSFFLWKGRTIYVAIVLLFGVLFLCSVQSFFYYFKIAPRMPLAALPALSILFTSYLFIFFLFYYLVYFRNANKVAAGKKPNQKASESANVSKGVRRKTYRGFFVLVSLLIIFDSWSACIYRGLSIVPRTQKEQQYAGAFSWLRSQPRGVVMANLNTAELLPLFTPHLVYLSKNAAHYPLPQDEELKRRLFHTFIFYGVKPENFLTIAEQWPYRYVFWGITPTEEKPDLYSFGLLKPVSEKEKLDLRNSYAQETDSLLSEGTNRLFKIDYIIYGTFEKETFPDGVNQKIGKMEKVFSDKFCAVYKIQK